MITSIEVCDDFVNYDCHVLWFMLERMGFQRIGDRRWILV